MMLKLEVEILNPAATLPTQGSQDAVGFDLYACLISNTGRSTTALVPPKICKAIPTGLRIRPPHGYFATVCSRSGLAVDHGLFVANAPGIIDPDYRGEIKVLLYNGGHESYYVQHGDKVAQLVLLPRPLFQVTAAQIPVDTVRGEQGFGSTGR